MRPLAILLALACALALPSLASAAVFEVDRSTDTAGTGLCIALVPNDCSLRDAVTLAAVGPDADVISIGMPASVASEITYGGPGPLTITGPSTTFVNLDAYNDRMLHVLAGAGPVDLAHLYINRHDAFTVADSTVVLVESASPINASFVDFDSDWGQIGGHAAVELNPPSGMTGSLTLANSSVEAGLGSGAALLVDRSAVVVRGSSIRGSTTGPGIAASGNSALRLVATRVSSPSDAPIDIGNGSLVLRHATLVTGGSGPLVKTVSGATINTGYSLLVGGATCFGAALTTSVGFNFTDRSAASCPELADTGDARALPHPGLASIDALATCGDDGIGGEVSSDSWSIRPVDGDGDGVARCDVGAREFGTLGTLNWSTTSADPHAGDLVQTRLLIERQFHPAVRKSTIAIPIPAALAVQSATPSAGITCVPGATLVCTVADGDPTLETEHAGFVDLTLTAIAAATVQLVATERDETGATVEPAEQTAAVSTWASSPFTVRITPTPPPPIIDPPIVKHFPNAYAGCTIVGTSGADHIVGTAKSDVICALGGNDVIDGKGGGDHIIGGDGKDRIDGGAGKDWIEGGPGNDRLHGGAGADLISGGLGRDRIWGGAGDDRISGGRGFDVLDGQAGKDRATGAAHDRTKRIEHGAAKRKTRAKKS